MKTLRTILLTLIAAAVIFWAGSILHCEHLTRQYYTDDMLTACVEQTGFIQSDAEIKILEYESDYAKVYARSADSCDAVLLVREGEAWKVASWNCIWSKQGSADEILWPYIR